MAKIDIENYQIKYSDEFFFDTNIWLLLFGPIADTEKRNQRKYSKFFETLIEKNKPIYITSLVLSEFSNVLLKKDYRQWISQMANVGKLYKEDFVGSNVYISSVQLIKTILEKILSLENVIKVGDSLHLIDMNKLLHKFEEIDFNDCYYGEICRVNGYKIVSNDGDLLKLTDLIDVITAR